MANILFGDPNFADPGYYAPLLSGGSWLSALPLSNAQDKVLSNVARSTDAAAASTRLHADLIVERDVRLLAACHHNLSRAARVRFRGSRAVAWSGVTLAANASEDATTLTVQCPGGSAMIRPGDTLTFAGSDVVHTVTGTGLALGGNLMLHSEDVTQPEYIVYGTTSVSADAATAPDGTQTADTLVEGTDTDATFGMTFDHGTQPNLPVPFFDKATLSVFLKPAGRRYVELKFQNIRGAGVAADFDIEGGEMLSAEQTGFVAGVVAAGGAVPLPGGWCRVWLSCQGVTLDPMYSEASQGWGYCELNFYDDEQDAPYDGDGESGVHVWGWQVEEGELTTYKRTGATAASEVASGTIDITPGLENAQNENDALTCRSGEYVSTPPALDSGWVDVWPVVNPWHLPWEHPSFWDGRITEEERQSYPKDFIYDHGETASARYWLIEFDDSANAAGYVEFGRLFVSRGYQPSRNFRYGNELGWQDETLVVPALGAEYADERERLRYFNFVIDHLPEDEALTHLFEMQRRLGVAGQLLVVLNPDDTAHKQRRSFVARNLELLPLTNAHHGGFSAAGRLREIKRA